VLKNSKLDGRKFRRQHSVGSFILDFYCVEESLAVELDGQAHRNENAEVYDLKRTGYLRKAGIRVLRFENFLVFEEIEYVLNCVRSHFGWKARASTTPAIPTKGVGIATPPIQEGSF
jgi:very-short-patch-repair endonuclease